MFVHTASSICTTRPALLAHLVFSRHVWVAILCRVILHKCRFSLFLWTVPHQTRFATWQIGSQCSSSSRSEVAQLVAMPPGASEPLFTASSATGEEHPSVLGMMEADEIGAETFRSEDRGEGPSIIHNVQKGPHSQARSTCDVSWRLEHGTFEAGAGTKTQLLNHEDKLPPFHSKPVGGTLLCGPRRWMIRVSGTNNLKSQP